MAERFPHLFLPGPTDTRHDFSSPRSGRESSRPSRNRLEHARHIKQQLTTAWAAAHGRQAVAHANRDGVYLEFISEPGFDLALKSLENIKSGIRLLTVRSDGESDEAVTRAAVYVPKAESAHFLSRVEAYASEDNKPKDDGTPSPRNAKLVESIADVKVAMLETSFWQDDLSRLPGATPDWVEAWVRSEDLAVVERFGRDCEDLGIEIREGRLTFPERTVVLIRATKDQLTSLISVSDTLAEFRAAREVATFFIDQDNRDQTEWVDDLLSRSEFLPNDVAVLILDHGVNNGHSLLRPVIGAEDCHTVDPDWGAHDDHGHGSLMAGTVAYGDLLELLEGPPTEIKIAHRLESAKILPPDPEKNPKRLWGWFTSQGVSRAEIQAPHRLRIVCMAVSAEDAPTGGRPTSWSGLIDELASGYADESHRLFILSAGNIRDSSEWKNYPVSNMTHQVQDPGQAWNALTVGAFTNKTRITAPSLSSFRPLASAGQLSPFSSTSASWVDRWPIKPEVVCEGGNVAVGPNDSVLDAEDLKLLSTSRDPQVSQFSPFDATSAAAAQVANMAARIQSAYPALGPKRFGH
jgi:hypothetical protein